MNKERKKEEKNKNYYSNILTIQKNLTTGRIIKPLNKVKNSGFPASTLSNKGNNCARLRSERKVGHDGKVGARGVTKAVEEVGG